MSAELQFDADRVGCSAHAPNPDAGHFDPAWRTSTVLALAEGITKESAFDRMPILADALQDAGCDDLAILNHCRHSRNHIPACWVLALILASPVPIPSPESEPPRYPSVFVEAARVWGLPGYTPEGWRELLHAVVIASLVIGTSGLWGAWLPQHAVLARVVWIGILLTSIILGLYFWALISVLGIRRECRRLQRQADDRVSAEVED